MSYKDEDDYDAINNHTFYLEYMDELISNWSGIDRFDELVDLFWSLEDNEVFCRFASIDKIANSGEECSCLINESYLLLIMHLEG